MPVFDATSTFSHYQPHHTLVGLTTFNSKTSSSLLNRRRKLTLTRAVSNHDTTNSSISVDSSSSPRFKIKQRGVQRAKLRLPIPGLERTLRKKYHQRRSSLRLKRPPLYSLTVNHVTTLNANTQTKEDGTKTHSSDCEVLNQTEVRPSRKRSRHLTLSLAKKSLPNDLVASTAIIDVKRLKLTEDQIVTMHSYMEQLGTSASNNAVTTNGGDYTTSYKHHDDDRVMTNNNHNSHNIKNHLHHSNSSVTNAASSSSSSNHQHHYHPPPSTPPIPPASRQLSASSMATLCNIGNTCYLNSVVYTLRFAPHFLHNLHHLVEDLGQVTQRLSSANKAKSSSLGRNVSGLAGSNTRSWSTKDLASMGGLLPNASGVELPRSHRQVATEKLHELYCALRRSEMTDSQDAFHADTFLSSVQDVSSIFEGNQQQDAHEFLMCVLDSIRETCQALTKVIAECPTIIMNGYVSVPDKVETIQPTIQSTSSVRLPFFRKRNKEEKVKQNNTRLDSPSKDAISTSTTTTTTTSTNNHTNSSSTTTTTTTTSSTSSSATSNQDTTDSCKTVGPSAADAVDEDAAAEKSKLDERIKELGLDFFAEDFEGVTVSSTKCLSCETVTEQKETMIDLSVPITGYETVDALDNPHQFIQNLCITREHFNSENKYRCEVCTGLTEAIRTVSYPVLPRLLIIQLKRFSGGMEKINSFIPTPFVMQCFCSKCCSLPDGQKLHVYRLYSVITHVGATLSVGHYIAYTSALEGFGDYSNCPKVKRKTAQAQQQQAATATTVNGGVSGIPPVPSGNEKNPSIIKKMIFGRSKASSSGDVTKHMKTTLNGGGSLKHNLTNGTVEKSLLANGGAPPCPGLSCCGVMTKNGPIINGHANGLDSSRSSLYSATSDYYSVSSIASAGSVKPIIPNGLDSFSTSATSISSAPHTNGGHVNGEKSTAGADQQNSTWYMCDDDKIKAMTQREFEELLSPNSKKIMITPYLLFYSRSDVAQQ